MNDHTYLRSAAAAAQHLTTALATAQRQLPEAARRQHWMFAQHDTAPWNSLRHWYDGQADYDPAIGAILRDLVLLSAALAGLRTVLTPRPTAAPELRVAKGRRPGDQ